MENGGEELKGRWGRRAELGGTRLPESLDILPLSLALK